MAIIQTLKQKNIDTGMGLERLAVVVQDVDSIFDVDTIRALRDQVCEMSGKPYGIDHEDDVSIRLITDHIRSATFMISDGIMPTNEGRGYVLRRLIRRAARHGRILGIEGNFLATLSADSNRRLQGWISGTGREERIYLQCSDTAKKKQFNKTIDQGLRILADMEEAMNAEWQRRFFPVKMHSNYMTHMDSRLI